MKMVYALEVGSSEHFRLSEGAEMMSQRGRERERETGRWFTPVCWGVSCKGSITYEVCDAKDSKVCCIGVSL